MRFTILLFVMAFAFPAAAKPARVADPETAIRACYEAVEKDRYGCSETLPHSARLDALFALDSKEAGGEIGRLDGDYFINGQDGKITASSVSSFSVQGAANRRIIRVRFRNFDQPMENLFYWERDGAGSWLLDDVWSGGPDGFLLSIALKYGWPTKD
jgi:hypothetical protein